MMGKVGIAALALALAGCGGSETYDEDTYDDAYADAAADYQADAEANAEADTGYGEELAAGYTEDREFDEDAAREQAEQDLANEGYDYRYGCTEDCSGHDAGWQYRANNGFAPQTGDSQSFDEGGRAFDEAVEERVDEARTAFENGEE